MDVICTKYLLSLFYSSLLPLTREVMRRKAGDLSGLEDKNSNSDLAFDNFPVSDSAHSNQPTKKAPLYSSPD